MDNALRGREFGIRSERRATGLVTLVAAVAWTATTAMILPGFIGSADTDASPAAAAPKAGAIAAAEDIALTALDLTAAVGLTEDACEQAIQTSQDAADPTEGIVVAAALPESSDEADSVVDDRPPTTDSTAVAGLKASSTASSDGITPSDDDATETAGLPAVAVRELSLITERLAEHAAAIAWYEERIAELEQRLDRFEARQGRSLPPPADAPQAAADPVSDAVVAVPPIGPIKRPAPKALTPLGSAPGTPGGLPKVTTGPLPGVTSPAAGPITAVAREVDTGVIRTPSGDEAKLEILGIRQVDRAQRSIGVPVGGGLAP
jgi:hypothetical protein